MRTLMRYVPRHYDPAIIEALALTGALDPGAGIPRREKLVTAAAAWLQASDEEATWTGEVTEPGGYGLKRFWPGVPDYHLAHTKFRASPRPPPRPPPAPKQRPTP